MSNCAEKKKKTNQVKLGSFDTGIFEMNYIFARFVGKNTSG
jgi:hypothetical protein